MINISINMNDKNANHNFKGTKEIRDEKSYWQPGNIPRLGKM